MLAAALAALLAPPAAAAPAPAFKVEIVETTVSPGRVEHLLKFPSQAKSPWPANDTVWAHLIVPDSAKGTRAPAVLVLPVMAAPNVWIETKFVDRFVRDGFVVMLLEMPTQFRRRPHPSMPSGQVFLARTAKGLARNFRQSIADARRALGALSERPEVDADRVALFGISLGAIVGSTVWSLDDRPAAGAFLMGGADFPALLLASSMTGPFARKMGISREELAAEWKGLDPLERREKNRGKRAYLINVNSDSVIPRANALKLKEAFPDSEQRWLPLGHYSAILHLVWLPKSISARLKRDLEGKKTINSVGNP